MRSAPWLRLGPPVRPTGASRSIVFSTGGFPEADLAYVSPSGGAVRLLARGPSGWLDPGYSEPAWSPDGRRLAAWEAASRRGPDGRRHTYSSIVLLDTRGKLLRRLQATSSRGETNSPPPAWSPDGRYLAVVQDVGTHPGLDVVEVRSGRRHRLIDGGLGEVAWSPNGRTLALAGPRMQLLDLTTGHVRLMSIAGAEPAWSPDGHTLAFVNSDDGNGKQCFEDGCEPDPELYTIDASGHHLRRLTHTKAAEHSPTWSPDGSTIAYVSIPDTTQTSMLRLVGLHGNCRHTVLGESDAADIEGFTITWQPGRASGQRNLC